VPSDSSYDRHRPGGPCAPVSPWGPSGPVSPLWPSGSLRRARLDRCDVDSHVKVSDVTFGIRDGRQVDRHCSGYRAPACSDVLGRTEIDSARGTVYLAGSCAGFGSASGHRDPGLSYGARPAAAANGNRCGERALPLGLVSELPASVPAVCWRCADGVTARWHLSSSYCLRLRPRRRP
jgi:hypothetical protein